MNRHPHWRAWRFIVLAEKATLIAARAIANTFDVRDVFFFGGLAIAAYGGMQISRPWTLVILGAVLVLKAHGPLIIRREE